MTTTAESIFFYTRVCQGNQRKNLPWLPVYRTASRHRVTGSRAGSRAGTQIVVELTAGSRAGTRRAGTRRAGTRRAGTRR